MADAAADDYRADVLAIVTVATARSRWLLFARMGCLFGRMNWCYRLLAKWMMPMILAVTALAVFAVVAEF